jgi:putative transposase
MPHSLSAVYIHLVFSTKNRHPIFNDRSLRFRLHEYIGGISKTLECPPIRVGGTADHVHILARFGRIITQADWVKEIKRCSNLWIKKQDFVDNIFSWQGGYADFSVSVSKLEKVKQYIEGQEAHHKNISFQDEVRGLLRKHGMEWDERYLWD